MTLGLDDFFALVHLLTCSLIHSYSPTLSLPPLAQWRAGLSGNKCNAMNYSLRFPIWCVLRNFAERERDELTYYQLKFVGAKAQSFFGEKQEPEFVEK